MYFDAHLHLDGLKKPEIEKYISVAAEAGVEKLFVNSTSLESNFFVGALANKYKEIVPGFGLHPLESIVKDIKKLERFLETVKKPFFIGEIGLDYKFANEGQKKTQEKIFQRMLDLAKEYDVYINVHSRYAQKQVVEMLEKHKQEKVIMHWFTSSEKYVKRAVENGYYINIGPTYLLEDGNKLYNIVKNIPVDKVLFETDFPVEISGKQYTSAEIPRIVEKYCNDFNLGLKNMHAQQSKNYKLITK